MALINISVNYKNITTNKITYAFLGKIEEIYYVRIDGKEVTCEIKDLNIGVEIRCPKIAEQNTTLELSFLSGDVLRKKGEVIGFLMEKPMLDSTDVLSVTVYLPEKAFIAESIISNSINPPNFMLSIDKSGRRIIVRWNIENPVLGEKYDFSIFFEVPKTQPPLQTKQKNNALVFIALGAVVVLSLVIAFIFFKRREKNIINLLKEDEKMVLEAIKELGNGCKHKDIVKKTGFSKAKVSRILYELQKRQIIRLERAGKNTKIYLN